MEDAAQTTQRREGLGGGTEASSHHSAQGPRTKALQSGSQYLWQDWRGKGLEEGGDKTRRTARK